MSKLMPSLFALLTLSSCFKSVISSKGTTTYGGRAGVTVLSEGGETKTTGTVAATSSEALTVSATAQSALSGTSILVNPQTFSISTSLVIEAGVLLSETSVQSEIPLVSGVEVKSATQGVIIRPADVVELLKPLQISLPLPTGTALNLATVNYAVYFKYLDPATSKLMTGLLQVDSVNTLIRFDEVSQRDVIQFSGYFGSYWVVTLNRPLEVAEIPLTKESSEAIVNKNLTTVIATTGVVTEKVIVTTQAIPPLAIAKPSVSFDVVKREVAAKIAEDKRIKSCSVDLYQNIADVFGTSSEVNSVFSFTAAVKKIAAHSLFARFRCVDENQKIVLSPWSDQINVPEYGYANVVSVSSSKADGLYGINTLIPIQVTFSDVVTVTGTPFIRLNLGANEASAVYVSGSGSQKLNFLYTVAAGDDSADLNYKSIAALNLPANASIRDSRLVDINPTLPLLNGPKSLSAVKNLAIDALSPTAPTSVGFASPYSSNLAFPVSWGNSTDRFFSTHHVKLCSSSDCSTGCLSPADASNSPKTLTGADGGTYFACVQGEDQLGQKSPWVSSLGTVIVDTTAPVVTGMTSTAANGIYKSGDSIPITVQFSKPVFFTGTLSQVRLNVSTGIAYANYLSGSGSTALVFNYVVTSGQASADLDHHSPAALVATPASSIVDTNGTAAVLTLPAIGSLNFLGANKDIVIDAVQPVVTDVSSSLSDGAYGPGNIVDINISFSKAVQVTGSPKITLNVSPTRTVNFNSGSGTSTLTFNYTIQPGEIQADLNVSLLQLNAGTIQDALGNPAIVTLPSSMAAGSLDYNKSIAIAGTSVVPVINSTPTAQNAYTTAAITTVDTNATGSTDLDADGQVVTYTCLFDRSNNASMDGGGQPCSTLPNSSYSFNASTGVLQWTPGAAASLSYDQATIYEFQIKGTDTTHLSGLTYFNVSVLKPFSNTVGYDAGTSTDYTFDPTAVDFSGGYARLQLIDQIDDDNSLGGFTGGTAVGAKWYPVVNQFVRLDLAAGCDGRQSNCAGQVDRDWAPQYASVVTHYDFNSNTVGWTSTSYPTVTSTIKKLGAGGLLFNGNQYLQRARSVQDDFTINLWLNTTQSSSEGSSCSDWYNGVPLLSNDVSGFTNDWGIHLCDGYILAGTGNPETTLKSDQRFNDGIWHMISFTRIKASGLIKLYMDGKLLSNTTGNTISLTAGANQYLGGFNTGTNKFVGYIDEVNQWSVSLSAADIQLIYDRQVPYVSGYYQSRIIDSTNPSANWSSLSWMPTKPFGKELPDYNSGIQNESAASYSSINNTALMNNIVGLWHLNETAAGTAPGSKDFNDKSGQGNHALASGAIGFGQDGRLGRAAFFDGFSSLNVGTSTSLDFGTNAFTMSFWIKTQSSSGWIFSNWTDYSSTGVGVMINPAGNIGFTIACQATSTECVHAVSDKIVTDNTWHHIVVENDKTYNVVKIYIDGIVQPLSKYPGSGACAYLNSGTTELKYDMCPMPNGNRSSSFNAIGSREGFSFNYKGVFDEFAVWKRALTSGDVLQLYLRGANRLLFQVRTCSSAGCPSSPWKGPDGTKYTYFSELNNNTVADGGLGNVKVSSPIINFADYPSLNLSNNRYFQYQYIMEGDDTHPTHCLYAGGGPCSPELKSVSVGPQIRYPITPQTIATNTPIPFYTLASFTETISCPAGVKYQLSRDNTNWYYYNGSAWLASDGTFAKSSAIAQLNTGSVSFAPTIGRASLYVKALLSSDGNANCTLDQVSATGNTSY